MSGLDSRIDALYQGPLEEFITSRNALAKTLTGDAKKEVSALAKPLAIPWIVNQTYWHARDIYDELLAAGEKLRGAQVGALQGRSKDVRAASDRHAAALAAAVTNGVKRAEAHGVQPQADALRRMFEAVSTRRALPAEHGRFVKPLEPAGFEALVGLSIVAPARKIEVVPATTKKDPRITKAGEAVERRREQERAEAERTRKEEIGKAEEALAEAIKAEGRARFEWERAKKAVEGLSLALTSLRRRGL